MLDLFSKENLRAYLSLAEFRENLITIKSNIIILEKQNKGFLASLSFFSLRYQNNNPNAIIFDLRPRKNIQFLLSAFFRQMHKNLTESKSYFTPENFQEIIHTIEDSEKFFKKSNNEQIRIKNNLDSYINLSNKLLINFFVISHSIPSL